MEMEKEYCCPTFKDLVDQNQIEYYNGWQVNGCCGGGCYVMMDIKICPYCGEKLNGGE